MLSIRPQPGRVNDDAEEEIHDNPIFGCERKGGGFAGDAFV